MQYISAFRTKLLYLLFCSHGEALQAAGHVTQALLEGCHQVSLHRDTKTVFSFSHSQISRTSSHQACSEQFIWTGNLLEASYMTSLLHLRCELTIIHSLFSMKKKKKKKESALRERCEDTQIKTVFPPWLPPSPEDAEATRWRMSNVWRSHAICCVCVWMCLCMCF